MRQAPKWILTAFLFALLLPAASEAQDDETLILLAAQESLVKAQKWIDFLNKNELTVDHYVLSELNKLKNRTYIAITGGLDEAGMKELLAGIIGDSAVASLEANGAGKMFLKEDVWKSGQKVLIFAGSDAEAAAKVRTETKDTWMEYLQEWFDLEEVPGGLRAY
jgi:hypothetical protein